MMILTGMSLHSARFVFIADVSSIKATFHDRPMEYGHQKILFLQVLNHTIADGKQ